METLRERERREGRQEWISSFLLLLVLLLLLMRRAAVALKEKEKYRHWCCSWLFVSFSLLLFLFYHLFFPHLVVVVACLFIVFVTPLSSDFLFIRGSVGESEEKICASPLLLLPLSSSSSSSTSWSSLIFSCAVFFFYTHCLWSSRRRILYFEMIFTLLLLTEIRDLQRRRKCVHGYELSITDRRRTNDNWRDESTHRALRTIHATFATSTNTSINRYEWHLTCKLIVYSKYWKTEKRKKLSTTAVFSSNIHRNVYIQSN